jgi:hypothetical protein
MTDEYAGACTNYGPFSVPRLAEILDEDHDAAWHQSAAFMHTGATLLAYGYILQQVREKIATAWPPETSPAARGYLAVLDDLLASINTTGNAAYDNGDAVGQILVALTESKSRIDSLNAEWTYNAHQDSEPLAFLTSSAPDNWQEDLNRQAWTQMAAADNEFFRAKLKMTVPDVYNVRPRDADASGAALSTGDQQAEQDSSGTSQTDTGSNSSPVQFVPSNYNHNPSRDYVNPPVLAGSGLARDLPSPSPTQASSGVGSPVGTGVFGGGAVAAGVIGYSRGVQTGFHEQVTRSLGSVGAPQAVQRGQSGPRAGSSETVSRPNPVGGLVAGNVLGKKDGQGLERSTASGSWLVQKGTKPIILPDPEPTEFDPGLGVFGIHR